METAEKEKKPTPSPSAQSLLKKQNPEEKNEALSNSNSNVNTLGNNNPSNQMNKMSNAIEFNKLQGFDVLEKLPPKAFNDTYNQEFYTTLDNLKFLSLSVPDEDKLFYHFEQNENASISATAGQVLKSFMELFMNKMTIRKTLRQCKKEFKNMKVDFDNLEPNLTEEIRAEIIKMEKRLQTFLVEQKTETIRLIKEIANLQKEKEKIKDEISACYERLNKLEKIIGTNKDYNRTIGDAKLANKNVMEIKKKKSVNDTYNQEFYNTLDNLKFLSLSAPDEDKLFYHFEQNENDTDKNMNTGMTGKTVTNPGEGLSEHFNVNTFGSNSS